MRGDVGEEGQEGRLQTRGRHKQFIWKTVLNHYLRKGNRFTNELR